MNQQEERELQAFLQALEVADPQQESRDTDRELVELVGLLAYAAEPEPVPAGAASSLVARLGLDVDRPLRFAPRAPKRPLEPRWARWALAASVFLVLGLGALSGALYERLEDQGQRLAELEQRFGWFEQTASDHEVETLQASVRFLSSPEMRACSLEATSADQPSARGTVYMNPQAGRWMLVANDLAPAPPGELYRIWFITESGPVSGGSFRVEDGRGRIEIGAEQLPPGLRAVSITIEPAAQQEGPSGQQVLFGDETHQVI
ncbi:MAG TPA: anti-sigma factor [Thermoanaerobaculia bacterium]|nr:anti-sigma factor [Thermoanaerobaculia bacterium]